MHDNSFVLKSLRSFTLSLAFAAAGAAHAAPRVEALKEGVYRTSTPHCALKVAHVEGQRALDVELVDNKIFRCGDAGAKFRFRYATPNSWVAHRDLGRALSQGNDCKIVVSSETKFRYVCSDMDLHTTVMQAEYELAADVGAPPVTSGNKEFCTVTASCRYWTTGGYGQGYPCYQRQTVNCSGQEHSFETLIGYMDSSACNNYPVEGVCE
jgi:hypothetical protein